MKNWTNEKVRYRRYVKQWVDVETGELITEEEFNNNYIKIKKNEYKKTYSREIQLTTRTTIARRKTNQRSLW